MELKKEMLQIFKKQKWIKFCNKEIDKFWKPVVEHFFILRSDEGFHLELINYYKFFSISLWNKILRQYVLFDI